MKILFVCTGNTCRSPLAALYVKKQLENDPRFEIRSAGLATFGGSRISEASAVILRRFGIDATAFRSRQATRELLRTSDLIVTVTEAHRAHLAQIVPEKIPVLRLLAGVGGNTADIPDPYGGDQASYDRIFSVMRPALDGLVQYLKGIRQDENVARKS